MATLTNSNGWDAPETNGHATEMAVTVQAGINLVGAPLDTSETTTELRERIHAVALQGYTHLLQTINTYMRVNVIVKAAQCTNDRGDKTFTLVLEREKTVEQVARQIEAQYAFTNMEQSLAAVNLDGAIACFSAIVLHNAAGTALPFGAHISDVLNTGDAVHVVGVEIGTDAGDTNPIEALVEQRCAAMKQFEDSWHAKSDEPLPSMEARCCATLHNLTSIRSFQEWCTATNAVEYMLFWLEVEVLRGLMKEASRTSDHQGNEDVQEISPTNKQYPHIILHLRYLYFTFLSAKSSMRLDLPESIRQSLTWPVPNSDPMSGLPTSLDVHTLDPVQEYVFAYISRFLYPRFEVSEAHANMDKTRRENPASFHEKWIAPRCFHFVYPADTKRMISAVEKAVEQGWDVELNQSLAPSKASASNGWQTASPFAKNHIHGGAFYGQGSKMTAMKRLRRIQRDRKLRSFFGDVPKHSDALMDAEQAPFQPILHGDSSVQVSEDSSLDGLGFAPPRDSIHSEDPTVTNVALRRKKAQKLESFFGDTLPREALFEQKLVDYIERLSSIGSTDTVAQPAPPTKNNLSPNAKKLLLQRTRKLNGVFGEEVFSAELQANLRGEMDDSISAFSQDDEKLRGGGGAMRHRHHPSSGSDESEVSLVSFTEQIRHIRSTGEYKRKKLAKIQRFLGERVSARVLTLDENAASSMLANMKWTPAQRQAYFKRVQKLQSMFGEKLPIEMLLSTSQTAVPNAEEERTGSNDVASETPLQPLAQLLGLPVTTLYECFLHNEQDVADFLQLMDKFDEDEDEDDEVDELELEGKEGGASTKTSDSAQLRHQATLSRLESAQQKRRRGKIANFFGVSANTAGALISTSNTDRIAVMLERHLKDVMDPETIRAALLSRKHGVVDGKGKQMETTSLPNPDDTNTQNNKVAGPSL